MEFDNHRFLGLITKTFYNDDDRGFLTVLGTYDEEDQFLRLTPQEIPDSGEVIVHSGLSRFTDGIHCKILEFENLVESDQYTSQMRGAKFLCRDSDLHQAGRWSAFEVVDHHSLNTSLLEQRIALLDHRPTEFIFFRDEGAGFFFGPFLVTSVIEDENESGFEVEFAPPSTRQLPPKFRALAESSYVVGKIPTHFGDDATVAIVDADSTRKKRKFLIASELDTRDLALHDVATDNELITYFDRNKKFFTEEPKDLVEPLKKVLELVSSKALHDPMAKVRRMRLEEISQRVAGLEDLLSLSGSTRELTEDSPEVEKYVKENDAGLLEKYLSKQLAESRIKHEKDKADFTKELTSLKKEVEATRKKSQAAQGASELLQKRINSLKEDHDERVQRLREEAEEKNRTLTGEILEKQEELTKLEALNEYERGKREEIKRTSENFNRIISDSKKDFTEQLLKQASMIEALQGRRTGARIPPPTYPTIFREPDSETNVLVETVDIFQQALESAGRSYSSLESASLLTSILQNFITVFYGPPGSGKTSLANLIGQIFSCSTMDTYLEVQVQRGWATSGELLGFENPLNGGRDYDRYGFFKALESLNQNDNSLFKVPAITLLDEANLSPIEHYWSDFMGLTDRFHTAPKLLEYPSWETNQLSTLRLPAGLRFLATINSDNTTEELSPRFLSRSAFWEVSSPIATPLIDGPVEINKRIEFGMDTLQSAFGVDASVSSTDDTGLPQIFDEIVRSYSILNVSVREQIKVRRHLATLEDFLNERGESTLPALDIALRTLVLPAIRGLGPSYEKSLTSLITDLENKGLHSSASLLEKTLSNGRLQNNYFSVL